MDGWMLQICIYTVYASVVQSLTLGGTLSMQPCDFAFHSTSPEVAHLTVRFTRLKKKRKKVYRFACKKLCRFSPLILVICVLFYNCHANGKKFSFIYIYITCIHFAFAFHVFSFNFVLCCKVLSVPSKSRFVQLLVSVFLILYFRSVIPIICQLLWLNTSTDSCRSSLCKNC